MLARERERAKLFISFYFIYAAYPAGDDPTAKLFFPFFFRLRTDLIGKKRI
jgi:hypothetical protein